MDEIKDPLCSVCNTAVAAFDDDGFILFLVFFKVVFFVFVLMIVFLDEKKDVVAFFNTAPDADDDIICSYQKVSRSRVLARACVFCVMITERFVLRRRKTQVMR